MCSVVSPPDPRTLPKYVKKRDTFRYMALLSNAHLFSRQKKSRYISCRANILAQTKPRNFPPTFKPSACVTSHSSAFSGCQKRYLQISLQFQTMTTVSNVSNIKHEHSSFAHSASLKFSIFLHLREFFR